MALAAGGRRMGASQLEAAQIVIELGAFPGAGCVARIATRREIAPAVVGIGGLLEIPRVATQAI
jgi:hypothetical protein